MQMTHGLKRQIQKLSSVSPALIPKAIHPMVSSGSPQLSTALERMTQSNRPAQVVPMHGPLGTTSISGFATLAVASSATHNSLEAALPLTASCAATNTREPSARQPPPSTWGAPRHTKWDTGSTSDTFGVMEPAVLLTLSMILQTPTDPIMDAHWAMWPVALSTWCRITWTTPTMRV